MKDILLNEIVRVKNLMNINEAITTEIKELKKIIRGLSIAENEKIILKKFFEGAHLLESDEKTLLEISKKPGNVLEYMREKIEALPDGLTKDAARTKLENLENRIKVIESSGIHDFDDLRIHGADKLITGVETYLETSKKYFNTKELDLINNYYAKIDTMTEADINQLKSQITQKDALKNAGFKIDYYIKTIDTKIAEAKKINNQAVVEKLEKKKQTVEAFKTQWNNLTSIFSTVTKGINEKKVVRILLGLIAVGATLELAFITGIGEFAIKGFSEAWKRTKQAVNKSTDNQPGSTPQNGQQTGGDKRAKKTIDQY